MEKLRSICILFILNVEFILSGLRTIFFSDNYIIDFELVAELSPSKLKDAEDNMTLVEKLENTLYPEEVEYIYISEDDNEDGDV